MLLCRLRALSFPRQRYDVFVGHFACESQLKVESPLCIVPSDAVEGLGEMPCRFTPVSGSPFDPRQEEVVEVVLVAATVAHANQPGGSNPVPRRQFGTHKVECRESGSEEGAHTVGLDSRQLQCRLDVTMGDAADDAADDAGRPRIVISIIRWPKPQRWSKPQWSKKLQR